ncbi:MAG: TatD family hydrolase [Candidatus Bathyarchaeia archaeon]
MKFIDAHIHLSDPEYEGKVGEIIKDARQSNVVALVSNSMNLKSSLLSLQLADENPEFIFAALGIHPWNVKTLSQDEVQNTVDLILQHNKHEGKIVAVGEIGLDHKYARNGKTRELQQEVFDEMLHASEKMSLPVIIHSRGTTPQILDLLPSYNVKKVLLHWFSRPRSLLPRIIDHSYYITEGPPAVFSKGIREVVRRVPLTNLLTETDGPIRYRGPFSGRMTTPSLIPMIVEAIAELKDMDENDVADQIFHNFIAFFGVTPV